MSIRPGKCVEKIDTTEEVIDIPISDTALQPDI